MSLDIDRLFQFLNQEALRERKVLRGAIRERLPEVPLIFLAGHTHVEMYEDLDERTAVMESWCLSCGKLGVCQQK